MIASRRGLAVLALVAAGLGALVARELVRTHPPPEDRALLPGLAVDAITALTWERPAAPAVTVTRRGAGWAWATEGSQATADARAVEDVIAALRGARWQRTGEVVRAGRISTRLAVKSGDSSRAIDIGEPLPGTEQSWLVIGDRARLVDGWVARALDAAPLALRERHPVASASQANEVGISTHLGAVHLAGTPRRQVIERTLLPRAELVAALERGLEAIEIVRLSRAPGPSAEYLAFDLGAKVSVNPSCPDDPTLAWVRAASGDGCIARATYDALASAVRALLAPAAEVGEPRPVPGEIQKVILPDAHVLELERTPRIDGKPVDPAAIAEFLAVVAAPAEIVAAPAGATARGKLVFAVRGGTAIALELLPDNLVRREGEPIALRLTPAAYRRLVRPAAAYADKTVWTEEPLTISSIQIDAVTYARGAVVGEWTRTPAGSFDPARVEALAQALASPRRTSDVEAMSITHRVTLTITLPVGAPVVHELAVAKNRCLATTSTSTVQLGRSVCDALEALVR